MSSQMVCTLLGLAHYRAIGVSCRFSLKPIVGEISLPTPYPSLFRVSLATNSLEFRRKKDRKKPLTSGYYPQNHGDIITQNGGYILPMPQRGVELINRTEIRYHLAI